MNIEDFFDAPFTFSKRKNFTACDTRPLWKACLIILVLGITGKNNCASLKKVHVANWIVKKEEHLKSYLTWGGKDERKRPNVRLEPAIDYVINLLVSNKLVSKSAGNVCLTESGVKVFEELDSEEVFFEEKSALLKSKRYLSEAAVKRVFDGV